MALAYIEQDNLARSLPRQQFPGGSQDQNAARIVLNGPNALAGQRLKVLECPSYAVDKWVFQRAPDSTYPDGAYLAVTSYAACWGTMPVGTPPAPTPPVKDGMFSYNTQVRLLEVTDGTSNTLLLGERDARDPCITNYRTANLGWWYFEQSHTGASAGIPLNYQSPLACLTATGAALRTYLRLRQTAFGSAHGGGANFCLTDGSVRFVSDDISQLTLQKLATKDGGEVIPGEY
jgi:prepilin-type processing-associated H-X9-DG protein